MKKIFLWVLIPLLAMSCSNNDLNEMTDLKSKLVNSEYSFYPSIINYPDNDTPTTKAGVYTSEKWDDYAVIKIYFMNGEPAIVKKVKEIASQYTDLTNLTFKYVDNAANSDVRIRFSYVGESSYELVNWSFLGTECLSQNVTDPTMNLVIQDRSAYLSSEMFRGEILRNFGRMLGMVYEYSHTSDGMYVELNKTAVMSDFQSNGWVINAQAKAKINKLFFAPAVWEGDLYENGITPQFDANSIMLPYIPSSWIDEFMSEEQYLDLIVEKENTQLSANDKAYIAKVYPIPPIDDPVQGPKGNITISLASLPINMGVWGISYIGWDYRINQEIGSPRIIGDYPTIRVGEYEWTTQNLRMKYRGNSLNFLNFDNTMVNFVAGNAFGNNTNTVEEFEKVFGTWVTELYIVGDEYNVATTYRDDDAAYTRNDNVFPAANVAFDLPDVTAILQLFGQMPHKSGDVYTDFRNYTFGVPEGVDSQMAADLAQAMPLLNSNNANLSGLSLLPLGSMDAHGLGMDVYSPNAAWTNGNNAFMTTGTGIKLKMKGFHRNFNFYEAGENDRQAILNQYLWHWGSARYCRAISDEELGYKLYVDESSDIVVYLPYGEEPESGYTELPRGIQRGVALSYLYTDVDKGIYYFTKSWSKIQEEATDIRYNIGVSN